MNKVMIRLHRVAVVLLAGNVSSFLLSLIGSMISMSIFGAEATSKFAGIAAVVLSWALPSFIAGLMVGFIVSKPTLHYGVLAIAWMLYFTLHSPNDSLIFVLPVTISVSIGSLVGGAIGRNMLTRES